MYTGSLEVSTYEPHLPTWAPLKQPNPDPVWMLLQSAMNRNYEKNWASEQYEHIYIRMMLDAPYHQQKIKPVWAQKFAY